VRHSHVLFCSDVDLAYLTSLVLMTTGLPERYAAVSCCKGATLGC
jgi:hypothetical protein